MARIDFRSAANYEESLLLTADECGVDREYWDISGKKHEVSANVRRSILQSLGRDVSSLEALERERRSKFLQSAVLPIPETLVVSEGDKWAPITLEGGLGASVSYQISLESGEHLGGSAEACQLQHTGTVSFDGRQWRTYRLPLPVELPLGYHTLLITVNGHSSGKSSLIVCPDRAYLPESLKHGGRMAGFNVTLYGLRSDRNWGCGDFTDLHGLIDWAYHEVGFSFIGLNPLHALHNRIPYNTSPYLPLSIFYKNLIYIDVENVPEFRLSSCAQEVLGSEQMKERLCDLRSSEFVRYQDVSHLKRRFLKLLFREFRWRRTQNPERAKAFADFCWFEGELLHNFAVYSALDEILHKQDRNRWTWQQWPEQYQSPHSEATRTFAEQHARTVEFYKYIQFVIEEQLRATQEFARQTGMTIGLYHDLAVATDSCGSDLWANRQFFVQGCRVGAPPDDFSPNGQDWAFPPPNKYAHRNDGYRLYRESIRKIVRQGGALRSDHVMRLFRLFWIPEGAGATDGIYVRDNATDLMRILVLESVRSGNIIVGEDLGTVTDEIRDMLGRFGILSYRLFYFEKNQQNQSFKLTGEYPRQALVSSTTHDLPTITGFWTYGDIEARKEAGLVDEGGYWNQIEDRKRDKQRLLDALHAENLLPQHCRRNTAEYPNWQRKMRAKVEELRSPAYQPYSAMFRAQLERTGRRNS